MAVEVRTPGLQTTVQDEGRIGGELSGAQITRERVSEECYRDAA